MNGDLRLIIKTWHELDHEELDEMNKSHVREWRTSSMTADHHEKNIFFLLKDDRNNILAQGQLVPINGVIFDGETFNIFGIGGIIANVKRQGHGKKIMLAIKDYLLKKHKTGVGFIGLPDFYKKCGFSVDKETIKRFVHIVDNKRVINTESDHICYLDSDDRFMEKVIKNPDEDIYLPRDPDW